MDKPFGSANKERETNRQLERDSSEIGRQPRSGKDLLAGVIGVLVIANWSWGLMRDTRSILLDMNLDKRLAENVRHIIEDNGDSVLDLHGAYERDRIGGQA
ncbi:hypothetical protein OKW32_001696 [Paraburkholderia youngii]